MKKTLLATSLLLLAQQSFAFNPINGSYAGGGLGGYYEGDVGNIPLPAVPGLTATATTPDLTTKFGFNGSLYWGYRFKERYRVELEGFYNLYSPDKLTLNGTTLAPNGTIDLRGHQHSLGLMLNGYVDFFSQLGDENNHNIPYIGLGIGGAQAHTELSFESNGTTIATTNDGSKFVYVYQGIIGFNYWPDDFTAFGVNYRYQQYGKLTTFDHGIHAHNISFTITTVLDHFSESTSS